jgi:hypothetical protein
VREVGEGGREEQQEKEQNAVFQGRENYPQLLAAFLDLLEKTEQHVRVQRSLMCLVNHDDRVAGVCNQSASMRGFHPIPQAEGLPFPWKLVKSGERVSMETC